MLKWTHIFLGMDVDGNDSVMPSTSAAAAPSIPIVRHEMAVSPIKPVTPIANRMYTSVQGKRDLLSFASELF